MNTTYINPPEKCDLCQTKITDSFFDGKTLIGPWANMCLHCYADHGHGPDLVTKFVRTEKGFVKTK